VTYLHTLQIALTLGMRTQIESLTVYPQHLTSRKCWQSSKDLPFLAPALSIPDSTRADDMKPRSILAFGPTRCCSSVRRLRCFVDTGIGELCSLLLTTSVTCAARPCERYRKTVMVVGLGSWSIHAPNGTIQPAIRPRCRSNRERWSRQCYDGKHGSDMNRREI
jgi:hypothetical protein